MGWNPFKDVKKLIGGGVPGLLGGGDLLFGKDYSKDQKKLIDQTLAPAFQQIPMLFGQSQAALMKSLSAIDKGYGLAHKNLAQQGQLGTRQIQNTGLQNQAMASQNAVSRGYGNSTVADAGQRAVSNDTSQNLAQLNTMLANIGSNLNISQGQDQANVYSNIANLGPSQASILAALYGSKLGAVGGIQMGKQGGMLPDLLKIGGSLITGGFG